MKKFTLLAAVSAAALLMTGCESMRSASDANAQTYAAADTRTGSMPVAEPAAAMPARAMDPAMMIASWPEASRMAAADMMQKYGPPAIVTDTHLMWSGNGPWQYTRIDKMESTHNFPAPHTDVMEQAIRYRVPADMVDDLARYDGSVTWDRTQGWLAARCDKEGANFLALNLANDIVTHKKTVAQARTFYAQAIAQSKAGQMPAYMQRLQFQPPTDDTADTDMPVTPAS